MVMPRRWPCGYYAYLMIYPDGTPIYAGAGKHNRANPNYKSFDGENVQRKATREWGRRVLVIIFEENSKEEAYKHEEKLILQYGRRDMGTGTLYNLTSGRGSKGAVLTTDRSQKISQTKQGVKHSEEHRAKVSASLMGNTRRKGSVWNEESRKKMSLFRTGKKLNLSESERQRRAGRARNMNKTKLLAKSENQHACD